MHELNNAAAIKDDSSFYRGSCWMSANYSKGVNLTALGRFSLTYLRIHSYQPASAGDMYLLSKHLVRYLASRASYGKYGAHCPKYGFPPMSRL